MAGEKLSGMEQMMHSLMRAAGFNPQTFIAGIEQTAKGMLDGINGLRQEIAAMNARLERIEKHLGIVTVNGTHTEVETPVLPVPTKEEMN